MIRFKKQSFFNGCVVAVLLYAAVLASSGCALFPTTYEPIHKSMNTDLGEAEISRTDYYEKLAKNYFEQENFSAAVDHYRLSLLHDEKNRTARFGLAQTYMSLQQDDLALTEFNRYISEGPVTDKHIQVLSYFFEKAGSLESVYQINAEHFKNTQSTLSLWKMYETSLHLKKYSQALDTLNKLALILPANDENIYLVHLSRAEVHMQQKNGAFAERELNLAEAAKPFDELVLKKKMIVQTDLEKWDDVILTGQKYIRYQKHTLPVSEGIAIAAIKTENYELAVEELEWQSKFGDLSYLIKLKIAHLYFLMKNYAEAEVQYKELYDLEAYPDEVRFYLALVYMNTKRNSYAEGVLSEIAVSSIYYPDAQVKLAEIDYNAGDRTAALNRLRKAHLLRKDSIAIYKTYSEYLIETNHLAEAVALLEVGVENTTPSDVLHINLAYCHYKFRNYKAFKYELAQATKINPTNAKTYEMLAELWYKDNKKASEVEYFSKMAIKLEAQSESLMKILAWVYVDQNKLDKAVALFETLYDRHPKDFFYPEMLSKIYYLKNIKSKSFEYATYARILQDEVNIKDYLNEMLQNKNTNFNRDIYQDQRRPASLE